MLDTPGDLVLSEDTEKVVAGTRDRHPMSHRGACCARGRFSTGSIYLRALLGHLLNTMIPHEES